MQSGSDRILATHVGSLPRSKAVTDLVFAHEHGEQYDADEYRRTISEAVDEVVRRQVEAGIDVVSDGEMSKISYATYIRDRLTGFEGDSPRRTPADLEDFPGFMQRQASSGGTPSYSRPRCTGPIEVKDTGPLEFDIANLLAAARRHEPLETFMNAASPGVIAMFQPSDYHARHEDYLFDLAEAMRPEYERIVEAGIVLQLDSPDLGLGRHMLFKDRDDAEYQTLARQHVEALNHALRNVPAERVRLHVCWGNYEGPHHHDAPMEIVLPIALKAKPQALLFESSNPRHAHEWRVFRDTPLPEDKILVPGVIDSTTNFIEHADLVAERIGRFVDLVGPDRVIAGSDCGFSTFAGFGAVDEDIVYAKLAALAEGARRYSARPAA